MQSASIMQNIRDKEISTTERLPVDLSFSVTIHFIRGKILALLFCENKSLKSIFTKQPEVSEYFYFNNADKPDDISDREWYQRECEWNEVLDNNTFRTPSTHGLIYDPRISGDYVSFDPDAILAEIESKEKRALDNAKMKVMSWWIKSHNDAYGNMSFSYAISTLRKFMLTDAYTLMLRRWTLKLKWRLRDINKKDLISTLDRFKYQLPYKVIDEETKY